MEHLHYDDIFQFGMYAGAVSNINFQALLDMGINFVYVNTIDVATCINQAKNLEPTGSKIQVIFKGDRIFNLSESTRQNVITTLQAEIDTFTGLWCSDEPHLYNRGEDNHLSVADYYIREANRTFTNKTNFINCFPNYAKNWQIFGEGTHDIVSDEDYNFYVNMIASTPTSILCGDFYGTLEYKHGDGTNLWPKYLIKMRELSLKYDKELWQIAICSEHNNYRNLTMQDYRLSIYLNMLFGAQAIIWFKYQDATGYSNSPFDRNGQPQSAYYIMQNLLTGEAASYGSLIKGASILNVGFYQLGDEMPSHVREVTSGMVVISNFTKGENEFLAVLGYLTPSQLSSSDNSEIISFKIYSNYRKVVNDDLSITTLPVRLQNSFEILPGELKIFLIH